MERWVTVRTPEAVAFSYELAGLGSRFLALLIDTVIQGVVITTLFIAVAVAATRAHLTAAALHLDPKTFQSTVFAVALLLFFTIFYGYFVFFEKAWNGQTPGKRALGIRVVRDGGYPVELMDSIVRNLIRILEMSLGFYFLSVVSMVLSSENKRLGDYAAGTIVVRDRTMEIKDTAAWSRDRDARTAIANRALGALTRDELALVDLYAARRSALNAKTSQEAAAKIAATLRPKLEGDLAQLPDDDLLMRIATREL